MNRFLSIILLSLLLVFGTQGFSQNCLVYPVTSLEYTSIWGRHGQLMTEFANEDGIHIKVAFGSHTKKNLLYLVRVDANSDCGIQSYENGTLAWEIKRKSSGISEILVLEDTNQVYLIVCPPPASTGSGEFLWMQFAGKSVTFSALAGTLYGTLNNHKEFFGGAVKAIEVIKDAIKQRMKQKKRK